MGLEVNTKFLTEKTQGDARELKKKKEGCTPSSNEAGFKP